MTAVRGWIRWAACLGRDPELWFSSHAADVAEALQICEACPVRTACLDYVLDAEGGIPARLRYGILAGLDRDGRRGAYGQRQTERGEPIEVAAPRGPGRRRAPCGTEAARVRHRRYGETCDDCHTPRPEPQPTAATRRRDRRTAA